MLRQRAQKSKYATKETGTTITMDNVREPLLGPAATRGASVPVSPSRDLSGHSSSPPDEMDVSNLGRKSQWLVLAVASGVCAAFNGVFAKLTTTELTTSFAVGIANLLGLAKVEKGVEVVVRAVFFGLNLIFNGIMWTLFTKALARGTSTTQVSIINTSSNFMITAVLGFVIFSESLPPLWWLGAALLVAGNVIIGRRKEEEGATLGDEHERAESGESGEGRCNNDEEAEGMLVHEGVEVVLGVERKKKQVDENIPNLGLDEEAENSDQELISGVQ